MTETYRLAFPNHPNTPYTHVSYGLPFVEACVKHVTQTFNSQRTYIIGSTSLSKQTANVKNLEEALARTGRHAGTWIGIRPHTPFDDLIPIIKDMRAKNADLLVTLGGGSLIDGAKIIIYALANGVQTLEDLYAILELSETDSGAPAKYLRDRSNIGNPPTVPMVFIPTTLSGGEYSRYGGGTDPRSHAKTIMTHPKMYASLIILDPGLCLTTTPDWVWLSTGVRAIDHAVEGRCMLTCPPEIEGEAEKALGLLIPNLLKTNPKNKDKFPEAERIEAALQCQLAVNYVLVMLLYSPQILLAGGSHGIGHQLGPLGGIGHGQTSCILLPAVLKYNKRVNGDRQEKVKNVIWESDPVVRELLKEAGLDETSSDASDALDVVFRALGMPRTLSEVGVGHDKFAVLADNSVKDPCCVVNPISLEKPEQVMEILEMVA
ncbi:putative Fe-containing alcohol dehydrogenase [Diplogelasinospora grovesii]|uniref:Fe-containing alcohol dehydrogenase n=1 Tax=Diplogelasinospora grovesii TaxID=303347 RepID=A0AAN6NC10_9PEZI|nr:putative Fe-containing alcohol dehydrogenase [Diplogelasinospora grovesii]